MGQVRPLPASVEHRLSGLPAEYARSARHLLPPIDALIMNPPRPAASTRGRGGGAGRLATHGGSGADRLLPGPRAGLLRTALHRRRPPPAAPNGVLDALRVSDLRYLHEIG